MMAERLTVPVLLDVLARHGQRVASVTMGDGKGIPYDCVASFTAAPADAPAATRAGPPAPVAGDQGGAIRTRPASGGDRTQHPTSK